MQTSCGCLKNGAIRATVSWFCITDMNRWTLQVLVTINSWLSIHKSRAFIGRARAVRPPILTEMSFPSHPHNHLNVNFFSSYYLQSHANKFCRTFTSVYVFITHLFAFLTVKLLEYRENSIFYSLCDMVFSFLCNENRLISSSCLNQYNVLNFATLRMFQFLRCIN